MSNPPALPRNTPQLEGLLYDQQNLALICAERPLDWDEYAHMNEFHGNAATLKRYAGLPEDQPIPFALEHAIPYDLHAAYTYDLNSALPTFFSVHEESAALYRTGQMEWVESIGFTYLYALDVFERRHPGLPGFDRHGTLVFPDKSTLLMDTDFDRAAFAQRLRELPEEYQPVVVCIYWKDFVRGQHQPFIDAGLPVVSAGHLRDPDFPLRLHDLCRRFRYACANDLAGSFVVSILSGCHFFHLPVSGLTQRKYGLTRNFDRDPTLGKPQKAACIAASPYPPESPEKQRHLVLKHAGTPYKKTPEELRRLVEGARARLQLKLVAPAQISLDGNTQLEHRFLFHALLPSGIDADGWVRRRASLCLPAAGGVSALKIKLHFWGAPQSTTVSVNGRATITYHEQPETLNLHLEADPSGGETLFEFVSTCDFPIPGESRQRAFHISRITLVPAKPVKVKQPVAVRRPKTVWYRIGRILGIAAKR